MFAGLLFLLSASAGAYRVDSRRVISQVRGPDATDTFDESYSKHVYGDDFEEHEVKEVKPKKKIQIGPLDPELYGLQKEDRGKQYFNFEAYEHQRCLSPKGFEHEKGRPIGDVHE